ncbi:Plastid-lipid-associated protein 6, chloroplastic [Vitis vinifera]|uniref:Plastid-lipid-associated protein 6, chloroplastic n=1 Tax=Vitis vinifera TaxID=29760 RepID=A0A438CTN6_VITVI|nr:Plastid-lipid-associated protein 6, chloroplastic [Vitis vinifera]
MTSLLHPLTSFSLSPSPPPPLSFSSSSSTITITCALPSNLRSSDRRRLRTTSKPYTWTSGLPKRSFVLRSTLDESTVSGLNRGLAAIEDDLQKADAAAKELEAAGGTVDLSIDLDKLQGRWKLIYSSAFSSRTLGGSRPGPPTGRLLPITLGQVFQRIDIVSKDFDNIVDLQIGTSSIKITFEKTTVKTTGNLSQLPPLEVPRIPDALRPPSNTGSGEFEVTYLDADTRITRGDRGELRVFVIA